jgi:hypothetical protein
LVSDMLPMVCVDSLYGELSVEPAGCGGQAGLLQAGHLPSPPQVSALILDPWTYYP